MSDQTELELDGHIYLVKKDGDGNVTSKDELDGELCLRLLVAILDDAHQNPILKNIFAAV